MFKLRIFVCCQNHKPKLQEFVFDLFAAVHVSKARNLAILIYLTILMCFLNIGLLLSLMLFLIQHCLIIVAEMFFLLLRWSLSTERAVLMFYAKVYVLDNHK